jgi:hypothetical protein
MNIIEPATNAVAASEAAPHAHRRVEDRVRLGGALALLAALGVLGGCGPVEPSETPETQTPGSTTTASLVISSELPASVVSYSPGEGQTAIAAGNGMYLVVWVQDYAAPPNIRAMRVRASDGALLDPEPIRIDYPGYNINPAVSFDGTHFLVVWENSIRSPTRIYGVRVRASDGAVLGSPEMLSLVWMPPGPPYVPPPFSYRPAVAFDGTKYLVVWSGEYYSSYSLQTGVLGIRVNPSNGLPAEQAAFLIAPASSTSQPSVAYGDGRYLVTFSGSGVAGVRIDAATRAVLDSTPIPIAGGGQGAVVASSGSQFLVSWLGSGGVLRGTRVRASDGAVLDSASLTLSASPGGLPAVTFDGRDYRVAWQSTRPGGRGLYSTRVAPSNGAVAGVELSLSGINPSTAPGTGIASTGQGRFLVSYPQRDAVANKDRLKLRLVDDPQSDECVPGAPVLVVNGGPELVLECQPGATYSDPGAQATDGCGNPVEVHAYNTGADSSGPGPNLNYEGSYTVSYASWNGAGSANASRTVLVDDRTAPVLTIRGPAHMVHTCNTFWVDPGADAVDGCYGNLTQSVWRAGDVNAWAEGTYTVSYNVTDSGGNSAAPVTRTVEVVDCPW